MSAKTTFAEAPFRTLPGTVQLSSRLEPPVLNHVFDELVLVRSMDDPNELRSLAQKCRRLADAISDGPARQNLLSLAAEYEDRIPERVDLIGGDEDRPLMRWSRN